MTRKRGTQNVDLNHMRVPKHASHNHEVSQSARAQDGEKWGRNYTYSWVPYLGTLRQQLHRGNEEESVCRSEGVYAPSNTVAFRLLFVARLCAVMMANIDDCDETYNYWEPTHFILFGSGFQTWEYALQYALRSYAFLWIYAWIPHFATLLGASHLFSFCLLRLCLALLSASLETFFYKAVTVVYGPGVSRLTLLFLAFSPGMFVASVSFLPSSFCLYMCLFATASHLFLQNRTLSIVSIGAAVLIAWPFSALLGVGIALDCVFFRRQWKHFFLTAISTCIVLLPAMMIIDWTYYQKPVLACWNIVRYNVFSPHGSELYGVEPLSYYLLNASLNMLLAFPLSILLPPLLLYNHLAPALATTTNNSVTTKQMLALLPLYIWFAVFFLQPHKEQRFLYPIYPLMALAGGYVAYNIAQKLPPRLSRLFLTGVMLGNCVLGSSRIASQFVGYHSPIDVWFEFNSYASTQVQVQGDNSGGFEKIVCMGREWHRFPSSFFLPDNHSARFIKSAFSGQLPALFERDGSSVFHSHFNDYNREETVSRYVPLQHCDYIFDTASPSGSELEPIYAAYSAQWTVLIARPLLLPKQSHPLCRAFYVPFVSPLCTKYTSLLLLKRNN